ncbi:MAG: fasciclin domain-containing protein [Gammaproteobacteria bacterium]|nr:fasciclin domain-containing protein [Gammaproteobacteria bacterium]
MKINQIVAGSAMALAIVLSACSDDPDPIVDPQSENAQSTSGTSITDIAASEADFSTLVAALQATGLDTVLADENATFTVFAPTNEAFEKLGQETINALLGDTDTLRNILLYHVVADAAVDAQTAVSLSGSLVEAANGDDISVNTVGDSLFINDSEVIATDILASNGIIHVIDTVLLPPNNTDPVHTSNIVETAAAAGDFKTLSAALVATGLDATLADEDQEFTVFAPTDSAFEALGQDTIDGLLADPDALSSILLYHVLSGAVDSTTAISLAGNTVSTINGADIELSLRDGSLFVNDSRVITTDIIASNGIIHVLDAVLIPPANEPPKGDDPVKEESSLTIFETAVEAGFTTLVAAAQAAGLDDALNHPDDIYTVFAPTDEAFAALGQDTIEALLADPETLRSILLYHVLPGTVVDSVGAQDLLGFDIQSGNGQSILLSSDGDSLKVNDATVIAPDIRAVNGVIHVIDQVLIPPHK